MLDLDDIDRRLLSDYQRGFPMVARPYAALGEQLGLDEDEVCRRLQRLSEKGAISRIGAVVRPHRMGYSTLAAMAVPPERLETVAQIINDRAEVNHNYQREHRLNLWFVVTATNQTAVIDVLNDLSRETGLDVLDLPMVQDFHIDLGFALPWT